MRNIYHIHIRKTAGTVIHRLLRKLYKKSQICPIRSEIELNFYYEPSQRVAAVRDYKLISGHFYSIGRHLIPEFESMTFLRHPVSRTISAFNHIQKARKDPFHSEIKGMSLTQALKSNRAKLELNNGQTRYLVGNAGYDYRELDSDCVEIAKSFVDQLFFVGIQEKMESSVQLLAKAIDIKTIDNIPKINTAVTGDGIKQEHISQNELDLIKEHNHYDLQVYQYVCEKLKDLV